MPNPPHPPPNTNTQPNLHTAPPTNQQKPGNKQGNNVSSNSEVLKKQLEEKFPPSTNSEYVVPYYHKEKRFMEIESAYFKSNFKRNLYGRYMFPDEITNIV
jgi:hypothetical protein